jgi:hypothetical protein
LSSLADEKRVGSLLLSTAARDPLFDCSLPLAAMFAELPPSSSELTERKALFRHLLLHTARRWGWCSLRSRNLF